MSQYTDLKNTIDANVNTNGVQSITGAVMNDVLNEIVDFAEGKQDALVSGTNIKTINGESILGSGDIEVQGGGGIAEEMEVYIGDTEPTEDGAKLWINPAEEGAPSVDNGIRYYVLPEGVAQGKHQPGPDQSYLFTTEEAEEFKRVIADWNNHMYIVMLRIRIDDCNIPAIFNEAVWDNGVKDLRIWLGGTMDIQDLLNSDMISIQLQEDGSVLAM